MLKVITLVALVVFVLMQGMYMRQQGQRQDWVDNCPANKTPAACIAEGEALLESDEAKPGNPRRAPTLLAVAAALVLIVLVLLAAFVSHRNRDRRP